MHRTNAVVTANRLLWALLLSGATLASAREVYADKDAPPTTTATPPDAAAASPSGTNPAPPASSTAPLPEESAPKAVSTPAEAVVAPPVDSWTKNLELHGGVYLWLYQPLDVPGVKNSLDIYFAHLILDAKVDDIGVHFEPRFRDKKLRDFFASNIWIQEAYVYWKRESIAVKVGKVYSRLGRVWDNSFYGNLPYFDGFKLSPEQGISVEGSSSASKNATRVDFAAQYFVIDGLTNGAYRGGDTLFDPGSRRRNIVVANLEPTYQISDDMSVGLSVSGEYFQADLVDVGKKDVYRTALGVNAKLGPVGLFGEYTYQNGQHVKNYPVPGTPATATTPAVPGATSSHNHYVWAGAEIGIAKFSARYNFSFVRYADVSITQTIHEPGIGYALSKNLSLLTEFVLWQTRTENPSTSTIYDRSLNFVAYGSF